MYIKETSKVTTEGLPQCQVLWLVC